MGLQWSLCAAFLRDFPRNEDDEAEGPPGFVPPHVVAEAELKQARPACGQGFWLFCLSNANLSYRLRSRMALR